MKSIADLRGHDSPSYHSSNTSKLISSDVQFMAWNLYWMLIIRGEGYFEN